MIPRVSVYSRHAGSCRYKGQHTVITCDCPKQLTWYRDGRLYRQAAGTNDGNEGLKKAVMMNQGFTAAATGEAPAEDKRGKLIEDAVQDFLASKAADKITAKHLAKLHYELSQFLKFALARGLVNLGDVTTEHVAQYCNSLRGANGAELAQNTRAKRIFRLIGFFRYCTELGWIPRNIAAVGAVRLKYDDSQLPKALTEPQLEILFNCIPQVNGRTTNDQRGKLRGVLLLMRWTGLAVRDALLIERSRFRQNGNGFTRLFLRRAKTGHDVFATLRSKIVEEIFSVSNPAPARYLFVDRVPATERERDALVSAWGALIRKLGAIAQLKDENGEPLHFTSHSMRHSFVYWWLNNGLPTEDIAMLLGDSPAIVAKHYSGWVAGRQNRLDERMQAALK